MTSVSLPNDLVIDIMSRVPGKSLARFRSVSKQLRSLLSDHSFLRLHHNRSRDSLIVTFVHRFRAVSERYDFFLSNKAKCLVHQFTVDFDGSMRIKILSSYHQLLCIVSRTGIHLCNPVYKELRNLPDPPWFPRCFNGYPECVSFGFVEVTMQYKVVKWPLELDEDYTRSFPSGLIKKVNVLELEVLNIDIVEDGRLKLSPWRRLHRPCPYLVQLSSQVQVNGIIYWTTSDFQIVTFSLQDETFSTLNPKPPCFCLDPQGSKDPHFFTLSGSRRNLWMVNYSVPSKIMEIWKMEESQGGGWAKIHKINLGGIRRIKIDGKVHIIDIWSDKVFFSLSPTCLLLCFDVKKNTLLNYGAVSRDHQPYHSTDGLLSLQNNDMSSLPKQKH